MSHSLLSAISQRPALPSDFDRGIRRLASREQRWRRYGSSRLIVSHLSFPVPSLFDCVSLLSEWQSEWVSQEDEDAVDWKKNRSLRDNSDLTDFLTLTVQTVQLSYHELRWSFSTATLIHFTGRPRNNKELNRHRRNSNRVYSNLHFTDFPEIQFLVSRWCRASTDCCLGGKVAWNKDSSWNVVPFSWDTYKTKPKRSRPCRWRIRITTTQHLRNLPRYKDTSPSLEYPHHTYSNLSYCRDCYWSCCCCGTKFSGYLSRIFINLAIIKLLLPSEGAREWHQLKKL